MPGGMPYQLEKGAALRLIEQHLNALDRDHMRGVLRVLRRADSNDSLDWMTTALPGLWADPAFSRSPEGSGAAMVDRIVRDWFGYVPDGSGGWVKPDNADTGYWLAYSGDVDKIVRRAFRWALELALGLGPDDEGPGRARPWQIELFWKCLAPWFEAWVVHRPIARADTGLVSVFFVTPTHRGANLAESPVATSDLASTAASTHPVPSLQDDYEELGRPHPHQGRPRVPAVERQHGTWVVTHRNHVSHDVISVSNLQGANNVGPSDFGDWGIPELSRYKGDGEIVVVAPSMASGGIKHDGSI